MKSQFAARLCEGVPVDSVFAVRSKEVRSARTGDAFMTAELADRSGRIPGVLFRPPAATCAMPVGTVARVRGVVTTWRGMRRISIEAMAPTEEYDRSDLMSEGPRGTDELLREFRSIAGTVHEQDLRDVLAVVFGDEAFLAEFALCPASQSCHHAYLGGLAEHTIAVATACHRLAETHAHIDRDLLVTAALLHDVGKVDELTYHASIEYTDVGRLLGHVVLGERRVREAAIAGARTSDERLLQLSHVILSHHGELEWGAPKRPATLEALALHHIDNLDAKLSGFVDATHGASLADEQWTDSFNLFRRPLWAPRSVEDDRPSESTEDLLASGRRV